jgi:hypothetical protein
MRKRSPQDVARKLAAAALLAALVLFFGGSSLAAPANELHVHVSVKITGHIDGVDEHTLTEVAEHALEAAHIIAEHHGGSGIIELAIEIHSTSDHGFHLTGHGGDWDEQTDADIVDHIDDMLIEMVHHFIDKAGHH